MPGGPLAGRQRHPGVERRAREAQLPQVAVTQLPSEYPPGGGAAVRTARDARAAGVGAADGHGGRHGGVEGGRDGDRAAEAGPVGGVGVVREVHSVFDLEGWRGSRWSAAFGLVSFGRRLYTAALVCTAGQAGCWKASQLTKNITLGAAASALTNGLSPSRRRKHCCPGAANTRHS
jgi:hypothetical protein